MMIDPSFLPLNISKFNIYFLWDLTKKLKSVGRKLEPDNNRFIYALGATGITITENIING
ncbi:hypothetical protein NIES4106_56170 (plasmid) [Fischerella sp. NIES-4106]|nr:hypothetical protein NIES4106_56170 [Fischerella sp. NIES-4106]